MVNVKQLKHLVELFLFEVCFCAKVLERLNHEGTGLLQVQGAFLADVVFVPDLVYRLVKINEVFFVVHLIFKFI